MSYKIPKLTKQEIINFLKEGKILERNQRDDIGTKSLTKPIKRTGKKIISFRLLDKDKKPFTYNEVHWKTGESIIKESFIEKASEENYLFNKQSLYKFKES